MIFGKKRAHAAAATPHCVSAAAGAATTCVRAGIDPAGRAAMPRPARTTEPDVFAIADAIALRFAETAAERDRLGGTPKAERDQLRQSGLLRLSIPRPLGGEGAEPGTVLAVVRRIARVDPSLAHVFGFHH